MSSIIRIKRSGSSGAPSPGLAAGELAYSFASNAVSGFDRLYIGTGTETNGIATGLAIIGGKYYTDMMAHAKGTLTASSALIADSNKKLDNLKVDNLDLNGNTLISTDANGDINITPDGTGSTRIKNLVASAQIITNLTATRVPYVGPSSTLTDSGNFTWNNSQNTLNVTGIITIDNLQLDGNTLSATNLNGDITLTPAGVGSVIVSTTKALVIPVGQSSERPTTGNSGLVAGAIRYNTTITQFEGYSGTNWASLGGVKSVDGLTYISAELTPGASDDTLRFYSNDVLQMSLDTNSLDISNTVGTTNFNANTTSTTTANGAVVIVGGVGIGGQLNVGGLVNKFTGTTESTSTDTGALVVTGGVGIGKNLNVEGNAYVKGSFTVAAEGTPSAVNIEASTLNLQSTQNATLGVSTNSATSYTLTLDAVNSGAGNAHLDINVDNTFTLDATAISIDATDDSNFTVTANSSSTKTLAIDSINTGTGEARITLGSTSTDKLYLKTDATTGLIDIATATVTSTATDTNINSNTIDIVTSGASDVTNLTTTDFNVNADTVDIIGKNGSANSTVNITGQLNVDNLRIDGNTISSTDGSNVIYIDPAPVNDNAGTLIIKGNLQVDGTTTTINSTQVTIDDPIFVLGGDTAPATDDNLDRGIIYRWYNSAAKIGFFGLDDSAQEFVFIPDAVDTSSVITGTLGNVAFGNLRLDAQTASTTTTSGTLKVDGGVGITGQLNVGGTVNKFTSSQDTSSVTTGALVISGGVGINKSLYIGDNITGSGDYSLGTLSIIDNFEMDGGTY
jgi:hypothetical protein